MKQTVNNNGYQNKKNSPVLIKVLKSTNYRTDYYYKTNYHTNHNAIYPAKDAASQLSLSSPSIL